MLFQAEKPARHLQLSGTHHQRKPQQPGRKPEVTRRNYHRAAIDGDVLTVKDDYDDEERNICISPALMPTNEDPAFSLRVTGLTLPLPG